jgi:hypothetical protein
MIACFDHIRYRRHDGRVFLYASDMIKLDGEDMRRDRAGRNLSSFLMCSNVFSVMWGSKPDRFVSSTANLMAATFSSSSA